jgi:hypothetical protein
MPERKREVGEVLDERGKRYGNYPEQCAISAALKKAMRTAPGYKKLNHAQEDALEMFAVKISRILNGDPNYADNWMDIAGYASLVAEDLTKFERKLPPI